MLIALAEHARGAVDLAAGDAAAALVSLRRSSRVWQELEAPYEAARARVLVGLACRALGDDEAFAFIEANPASTLAPALNSTPATTPSPAKSSG